MAHIATTQEPGASFGNTGEFRIGVPTLALGGINKGLPVGVNAVAQRPSFADNNDSGVSRLYGVGGWTDNLVLTENYTLARQGIAAPIYSIVNASGSGLKIGVVGTGTGVTGDAVCYVSWWDDLNQRRSGLSAASPLIAVANKSFLWNNLPIDGGGDATVTHIELWRAMDGQSPRLVSRHDLGTTTVTEAVPTLSLGEAFGDPFQKFPRCSFNVFYHDRQAMAGDPQYPDRVYLSLLNEPEHYGGLYLRTRKGERVVGLTVVRDLLTVWCATSSYIIQGYTEDDLEMVILEPQIGCISHFAIANLHGLALIPAQIGWYLCTGNSMHPVSGDFQWTWRAEFAANITAFSDSWAVNDIETNTYKLYVGQSATPLSSPQSLIPNSIVPDGVLPNMYWTIDYTDMIQETGGTYQKPRLAFDVRAREDHCAAMLALPGEKMGHLYTGSCDGTIRQENINDATSGSATDDGDAFNKTWYLLTGCYFMGDPGGGPTDAATWSKLWNFMECEASDYLLGLYVGDEREMAGAWSLPAPAPSHVPATYEQTIPAGLQQGGTPIVTSVPQTVAFVTPNKQGRGIAVAVTAVAPAWDPQSQRSPSWKGFGGTRLDEGSALRGTASIQIE